MMLKRRKKPGVRPIKVDYSIVERLAEIGCTDAEIAASMGVSPRTVWKWKKSKEYGEFFERGKAKGLAQLRRLQWKQAEEGNTAMLIFLGKVMLGQKDTAVIEHKYSRDELIDAIERELETVASRQAMGHAPTDTKH